MQTETPPPPDTKDHAAVLIAEALVEIHKYQRWQFYAILIAAISLITIACVILIN